MSLSKQLLILISIIFLIIFSINFIISINNIKSYLEGEAEIYAQDTATSLGLSLSPYMADEKDPTIETMMNAIFDMGYYEEIMLVNIDNQPLVTLTNKAKVDGVPQWFVDAISMKTARAQSEISSGWNMSGVIFVKLNPGYAYLKLYEQAKSSFYFSLITFAVSILLLSIALRYTLCSLKKINEMALTVADGRFETIRDLPWTTEVRNVANSMNIMSHKIESAINSLNTKLETTGKKLHLDDLTGLGKKSSFNTELKKLFVVNDVAFIFLIKVDGLCELVKELGSDQIEVFLKEIAHVLNTVPNDNQLGEVFSYRFFGAEFALIVKQITIEQADLLAQQLSHEFANLGEKYQKPDIAHIGVVPFNPICNSEGILLAAHEAYEKARIIGENGYFIRTCSDQAKDIAEWKSLVFNVVDHCEYKVVYLRGIDNFQSGKRIMEEAFTQITGKNGEPVAIATFVSIAEKFEKIIDLDKGVTEQAINYIQAEKIQHGIAISLSTRTVKNSDFRRWLSDIIKQNQAISGQLIFSLSAYAVAKEVSVYKEFISFIHQLNAKVMIKRFETQSMVPKIAKQLKPDFIRLAREIGNGVATDEKKKLFVETLQDISELLDINVLAENVENETDYHCIKAIGILGASR